MQFHEAKERKLVERKLVRKLKERKIVNFKMNPENAKGLPDRAILVNTVSIYVECKAGKELGSYYKQTPMQALWEEQLKASGSICKLVVGPKGVDEFIEWLDALVKKVGRINCFVNTTMIS